MLLWMTLRKEEMISKNSLALLLEMSYIENYPSIWMTGNHIEPPGGGETSPLLGYFPRESGRKLFRMH